VVSSDVDFCFSLLELVKLIREVYSSPDILSPSLSPSLSLSLYCISRVFLNIPPQPLSPILHSSTFHRMMTSSYSSLPRPLSLIVCLLFLFASAPVSLCQPMSLQTVLRIYNTSNPSLAVPSAVAVSSTGLLYIADTAHGTVVRMSVADGSVQFRYASQTTNKWYVVGVDVDSSGNVYIADIRGGQVLELDPNNQVTAVYNATNLSLNKLASGVAVDLSDNVYIADTFNYRIVKVDPAANFAVTVLYQSKGLLTGVAITSTGAVIVADQSGKQALKLSSEGQVVMVWNTSSPSLSQLNAVCVDSSDNIYLADTGNNRVVQMSATSNTVMAIYTTSNPALAAPMDVAVDLQGVVYIADSTNNRIVAMQGISPPPTNSGSAGRTLYSLPLYFVLALVGIVPGVLLLW
jgi:tripartite motif-containing protein 71